MDKLKQSRENDDKKSVLIADDTAFFRIVLGDVLSHEGYSVIFAKDGTEALELIHTKGKSIKLLIMDIQMPGLTGVEVLEKLHEENYQRTFSVLIMTGRQQNPQEIKRIRELGIDGFISKTEPPKFFVTRIKQALS